MGAGLGGIGGGVGQGVGLGGFQEEGACVDGRADLGQGFEGEADPVPVLELPVDLQRSGVRLDRFFGPSGLAQAVTEVAESQCRTHSVRGSPKQFMGPDVGVDRFVRPAAPPEGAKSWVSGAVLAGLVYGVYHSGEFYFAWRSPAEAAVSLAWMLQFAYFGVLKAITTLRTGSAWIHIFNTHMPHLAEAPEVMRVLSQPD